MMKKRERIEFRRGDILWIQCDPSVGVEPRKIRACVVVSNDIANRFGKALTVVPRQAYMGVRAARAYIVDLRHPDSTPTEARDANASMVMTYDHIRVVRRAGLLSALAQHDLGLALSMHLGLTAV
jgi:mRNA interferase MazF